MTAPEVQKPPDYFRIAWQSSLAASLCLGLPAGLLFWLILIKRLQPSYFVDRLLTVLQDHGTLEIIGVLIGAAGWGILLSRISGYRPMWRLIAASLLGVYLGRRIFWLIYAWINYDFTGLSIPVTLAIHLCGLVLIITFCTGLTHGLILLNWKAALTLALATGLVSVFATVTAFVILDQLGIHVGTGNAAMPKVAAVCTMVAGISGGTILGMMFSRFVQKLKI